MEKCSIEEICEYVTDRSGLVSEAHCTGQRQLFRGIRQTDVRGCRKPIECLAE